MASKTNKLQDARDKLNEVSAELKGLGQNELAAKVDSIIAVELAKRSYDRQPRQMPRTTKEHIAEVKRMLSEGLGQTEIAHHVGISVGTVGRIKRGEMDHVAAD